MQEAINFSNMEAAGLVAADHLGSGSRLFPGHSRFATGERYLRINLLKESI